MSALYALVGAGGFGKEVMPVLDDQLRHGNCALPTPIWLADSIAFADEDESKDGHPVMGYPVFALRKVEDDARLGLRVYFNVAIGDSAIRERIAKRLEAAGAHPFNVVSLRSNVQRGSLFGAGAIVCPFATINASAVLGEYVHLNIYSYAAHDVVLGDYVTLAPMACVNGKCKVGDHAYIGTGAILLPGVTIGARAVIGAGAVVTKDVAAGMVVAGVPAKFRNYVHGYEPA